MSTDSQPTYTDAELSKYISRIFKHSNNPPTLTVLKENAEKEPLKTLALIQLRHLSTIPWNSIALHYSQSKNVSVTASDVYDKLVTRGLGGYCMETNALLATVLRSLDYDVYVTGARISAAIDAGLSGGTDDPGFCGWEHMIIFVFIKGVKYHVDVGFANFGPIRPVVLEETPEGQEIPGPPGVDVRLRYRSLPNNTRKDQKYWILETRNAGDGVWRDGYAFTELEFIARDFRTFSYRTHRDPTSWFTFTVICAIVTAKEVGDGECEATGTLTLIGDTLSRREGPTAAETVLVCQTEGERVEALEKWFGIHLTADEIAGIEGLSTAIIPAKEGGTRT